jgi:hypothetical protein
MPVPTFPELLSRINPNTEPDCAAPSSGGGSDSGQSDELNSREAGLKRLLTQARAKAL